MYVNNMQIFLIVLMRFKCVQTFLTHNFEVMLIGDLLSTSNLLKLKSYSPIRCKCAKICVNQSSATQQNLYGLHSKIAKTFLF